MKKYYAVQVGRKPGIYDDWESCKEQIEGFPGAVYKSFKTYDEAYGFLGKDGYDKKVVPEISVPDTAYAFTDGSYNPSTGIAGWGGFIVFPLKEDGKERHSATLLGEITDPEENKMRNVAGEIRGAMDAVFKAYCMNFKELTIFYDYIGVEKWITGEWSTNNIFTAKYVEYVRKYGKDIRINFVHVPGHAGIPGNEQADKMAKKAVGVK